MASHIQKVMYEGYLGGDPESRYTGDGDRMVTNFNLGSTRTYNRKNGEEVKETTWVKVAAWGKLAELTNKYLSKGSHVIAEGRLRTSPSVYTTKDGEARASWEMILESIRILTGNWDKSESSKEEDYDEDMDDIPF